MKFDLVVSRSSDRRFRLSIACESSRVQFVELDLSPEEFSAAITGMVTTGVEGEVRGLRFVGSRVETKTELVPFDTFKGRHVHDPEVNGDPEAQKALNPFEVDGWQGSLRDMRNYHRRRQLGDGVFQEVNFYRHVNPETGEPVQ